MAAPAQNQFFVFYPKGDPATHCANETMAALFRCGVRYAEQISEARILADRTQYYDQATLVLPGGRSLVLYNALQPVCEEVDHAIFRGWHGLGICAGADNFSFELEIQGEHPIPLLGLLPIRAKTPALKDKQAGTVPIKAERESFDCFWNQGSSFTSLEGLPMTKVVATYQDGKAAGVEGVHGNGTVVALGFHPEIHPTNASTRFLTDTLKKVGL